MHTEFERNNSYPDSINDVVDLKVPKLLEGRVFYYSNNNNYVIRAPWKKYYMRYYSSIHNKREEVNIFDEPNEYTEVITESLE